MNKLRFPKQGFYLVLLTGILFTTVHARLMAAEKVKVVKLSQDQGFYKAPFTLTLRTSTPDANIRYTTNGSIP